MPTLLLTLENPEWIIIAVIVLVLFGGSRLSQLGGALGQSIREFRQVVRDEVSPDAVPPAALAAPTADIRMTKRHTAPPAADALLPVVVDFRPPAPADLAANGAVGHLLVRVDRPPTEG